MKNIVSLIKKAMKKEEPVITEAEVREFNEPESENLTSQPVDSEVLPVEEDEEKEEESVVNEEQILIEEEPTPVVVFEKCGCPENANRAQWQLDKRCMFCGKEFYSTI